jgi:hypothetical protein
MQLVQEFPTFFFQHRMCLLMPEMLDLLKFTEKKQV